MASYKFNTHFCIEYEVIYPENSFTVVRFTIFQKFLTTRDRGIPEKIKYKNKSYDYDFPGITTDHVRERSLKKLKPGKSCSNILSKTFTPYFVHKYEVN